MAHIAVKKEQKSNLFAKTIILVLLFVTGVVFLLSKIDSRPTKTLEYRGDIAEYKDSVISNFTFKYNPLEWSVKSEDVRNCTDVECGEPVGRRVDLISKKYGKDLWVPITLGTTPYEPSVQGDLTICFAPEDITDIGSDWYRAKNPNTSPAQQEMNKNWDMEFYPENAFLKDNPNKCIQGGINSFHQNSVNATYNGKPVYMSASIFNRVSPKFDNAGDEIIKSIKFL